MTRLAILSFVSLVGLASWSGPIAGSPPGDRPLAGRLQVASDAKDASKPRLARPGGRRIQEPGHPIAPGRQEVSSANATLESRPAFYVGAIEVYPWSEGAIYRLSTSPGQVSDIALQAGESLISVAAGDTARWVIGDTASGTGTTRRTHILVKPSASGLSTNLVIATDRRVYHLEVESIARAVMANIAWTYPDESLLALKAAAQPREPAAGVELAAEALDFNYRIEGDHVPWRPLRAFDDGRQVFIEFPPSLVQSEAPPLFVRGPDGRPELVNYRVRGRYYVVDRLFLVAELRLGGKQVVRIVRDLPRRGRAS